MESIDSLAKAINQFEGGVVLVSHDMRLISQVAREIWLCDHLTVMKFAGEISDFKMKLRSQMQKNNLIEGGNPNADTTKSSSMFVAITPSGKFSATAPVPTIAPTIAPVVVPKQAAVPQKQDDVLAMKTSELSLGEPVKSSDESAEQMDEKTIAKLRKKAEKDAAELLKQKEEEERRQRREEKLRDIEEAKRLKEEMLRLKQAAEAEKAALEVFAACHPVLPIYLT